MANLHKIKEFAKDKNIPIKHLANILGVTEQGMHKMIREETVSAVNLEKIARVLRVNICAFFEHDVVCNHVEQYTAKGDRGMVAKNMKVDNRNVQQSSETKLQSQIIELQKQLIEMKQSEIDNLKGKK